MFDELCLNQDPRGPRKDIHI